MKKLTLKQEKFVRITAKTLNPIEAVRQTYNLGAKKGKDKDNTASSIAVENMRKPAIKQELREVLAEDIDSNKRSMLISRNATQSKNIPASNQALDMLNKIGGDYAPEKHINANVNITNNNIDKKLEDIINELKQLQPQS